jgi:hypothetical protein
VLPVTLRAPVERLQVQRERSVGGLEGGEHPQGFFDHFRPDAVARIDGYFQSFRHAFPSRLREAWQGLGFAAPRGNRLT